MIDFQFITEPLKLFSYKFRNVVTAQDTQNSVSIDDPRFDKYITWNSMVYTKAFVSIHFEK